MLRRLISVITEDDNPRLHRVPFLLLWMMSYGLAWYVLYIYEILWYDWTFDEFLSWIKFTSNGIREAILIGFMFGLVLSFIQTWLIRQRYGYAPRFWRAVTIIGATIAGYGYPRVGLRPFESIVDLNSIGINNPIKANSLMVDFLIWFIVLNLFQAIVMLQINRKSWIIVIIGILAGIVASMPMMYPRFLYGRPMWTLIMGTMIQAIGTGLILLYLMGHPREGAIPKPEGTHNNKIHPTGTIATTPFILLWIGIYYLHLVLRFALPELWRFMVYYSPTTLYNNSTVVFS